MKTYQYATIIFLLGVIFATVSINYKFASVGILVAVAMSGFNFLIWKGK